MWPFKRKEKALHQVPSRGGWRVLESFPGAWQRNVEVSKESVLAFHAVFACMTLIARDIAKLRVKLVQKDGSGIWSEVANPAYSPVLRKPNSYQTRIQFWESWVLSKLSCGNTYVLKVRDGRGVVMQMHILDPARVKPLIADDGSVFYEIQPDNLSAGKESIVVPAREIIHDRFNTLFHPLVGLSPIFANGLAATQGLNIQNNSASFFGNRSVPGGILTAPGAISDETAARLKETWEERYSGRGGGKIAVLGDGLKFEALAMKSTDAQMIEQLKWTAEVVCSTYHVPPYKIGIGQMPTYNNIQALNVEYYSQCLQSLIEDAEICLDEGLGMAEGIGTEFDLDGLLRMDSVTQMEVMDKAKGIFSPNEMRRRFDLGPKKGGDSPMLQEQNYSLEALAKRDARPDPWAKAEAAPQPDASAQDAAEERAFMAETLLAMRKSLEAA
ncbi:phage portal protein [Paracoccus ferrooxidans]|nr:phage portal protein [Paracoccus ferrooxidans]